MSNCGEAFGRRGGRGGGGGGREEGKGVDKNVHAVSAVWINLIRAVM